MMIETTRTTVVNRRELESLFGEFAGTLAGIAKYLLVLLIPAAAILAYRRIARRPAARTSRTASRVTALPELPQLGLFRSK